MAVIPAELMQQFLRVDKRYSINPNEEPFFDLPTSLKLEKLEYVPPTAEEIRQQAVDELSISLNKNKDKINETYQKTINNIAVKRKSAQNKATTDGEKADAALAAKKSSIDGDMLRRGLSRSSVYAKQLDKAEQDAAAQKAAISRALQLTLDELTVQEQNALAVKNAALDNLEDNYQAELEQKIFETTEAVNKKIQDVAKYNNSQEEKEINYKKTWTTTYIQAQQSHSETAMKLQGVAIDKGYEVIQGYIYKDKATFTKDYYLGLDAQAAYNSFTAASAEFNAQLSAAYYNEVLAFLQGRL